MDFYHTIEQKGYRREDLKPEHQSIMKALDFMQEDLENLKSNMEMVDEDFFGDERPKGLLEQIKWEYAKDVIDAVIAYYDAMKAEFQVSLAESEDCESSDA